MKSTPDRIADRSQELFVSGLCCSESVLQAIAESRGIKSDLIPRIATGLCAGVSRTSEICGAVSGGVLAIGMVMGRDTAEQPREECHRVVRRLMAEFEGTFGSTNCGKLIGCRLDTPEGQQFFKDHNLRDKCAQFTREAARMTCRAIEEQPCKGPI